MKTTIKLFSLLLIIGLVGFVSSCNDDDQAAPVITYPDNGQIVQLQTNETYNFTFTVIAEGGYKVHALTATGGTVDENSSTPGSGVTDFTISGIFTAGDVPATGAINLSVTDGNGKISTAAIGVNISN